MMHPEVQVLINGPIAQSADLKSAIVETEKVIEAAAERLKLKNKSLTIQDSTPEFFQDDDFKLYRESSYIRECLTNKGWHGHLDFDSDYAAIQSAVKSVINFAS